MTSETAPERYARLSAIVAREPKPCALVDLDAFEANIDRHLDVVKAAGKTLRPASKSLRCVDLLRRIAARGDVVQGTMCYATTEAAFLVDRGFDDLFVAYPTMQRSDAELLADLATRATVAIVVDDPAQLDLLEAAAEDPIPVIVEVDLAWRPMGVHLGARRSPLRTPEQVVALAADAHRRDGVRFHGIMGYESQVAGLQDANPFAPMLNPVKRLIRAGSRPRIAQKRAAIAAGLAAASIPCPIFNGGGTGSLHWTTQEDAVTEVTAGSGFLAPHLFDYYSGGRVALDPALAFALQVVRIPGPGWATCHGGGFIASGEASADKHPLPWLPAGVRLLPAEGAGEVQTPLRIPRNVELGLGDPVFFRPAKAGEPAEHFTEYLLIRGHEIEARVPTYRGEGGRFL
jgi:D-serine deaminase-like pyridoxal phosphate-dependent protein